MWVCVLLAAALAGLAPCDARPKGGKNDEALGSAEAPENPSCQDVVGAASHKCPRTNLQAQTQEYIDAACESAQKLVATKDAVVERVRCHPLRPARPACVACAPFLRSTFCAVTLAHAFRTPTTAGQRCVLHGAGPADECNPYRTGQL